MMPQSIEDFIDSADDRNRFNRWIILKIIEPVAFELDCRTRRIRDKWNDFKNAKMRVKKGYDLANIWNMNDWFIDGAVGILESWRDAFKDCDMEFPSGTPCIDDEDGNEMTHEKWTSILLEMLEGFKLWQTFEGSGSYPEIEPPEGSEIREKNCLIDDTEKCSSCFAENGAHYMTFDGVWHKCSMTKDEEAKYQHALNLFARYHGALWD